MSLALLRSISLVDHISLHSLEWHSLTCVTCVHAVSSLPSVQLLLCSISERSDRDVGKESFLWEFDPASWQRQQELCNHCPTWAKVGWVYISQLVHTVLKAELIIPKVDMWSIFLTFRLFWTGQTGQEGHGPETNLPVLSSPKAS